MHDRQPPRDPRIARTRRALLDVFLIEVLSKPYERITVDLIARRAGVSRSTFYVHFAGKNALLAASLRTVFEPFADAVGARDPVPALTAVLEHFWQNRDRARSLFGGTMRQHTVGVLARMLQQRLARGPALILPRRIAALQIAECLLSPVIGWLVGEAHCPAARLAAAVRTSGVALCAALRA